MGLAKQAMLEDIDRGYCSVGEQYVCASCFNDEAIEEFIEENAESDQCDFCGEVSDEGLIAAPIDKVIELIVESIEYEWGSPEDEGVAWESREGGWQGCFASAGNGELPLLS